MTSVYLNEVSPSTVTPFQLKNTLFKIARFVLEQGTQANQAQFALAFIGRYYQALNLWPVEFTERLFDYAKELSPQDRVALGQSLSHQLSPWLSSSISELELAEFFRSICLVLSQCEGNLLTLLSSFNEDILSPIKTRLNPRKLIEVEERMGSALYQAILDLPDSIEADFIPPSRWPSLSEYTLMQSLAPIEAIFPFSAIRKSDQTRCIIYISDEPIQLLPYIEQSEWPIHCVRPLESGRSEIKDAYGEVTTREVYWVSLPATGPIRLKELLPYVDIYTALYIGEQLLETLGAIHQLGVTFRNLSPEDVVIDHRFQLQLLPYPERQARDLAWSGDRVMRASEIHKVYMSPEQRLGHRADLRSDLWAFGSIFMNLS